MTSNASEEALSLESAESQSYFVVFFDFLDGCGDGRNPESQKLLKRFLRHWFVIFSLKFFRVRQDTRSAQTLR
jgi:hypothetical protein